MLICFDLDMFLCLLCARDRNLRISSELLPFSGIEVDYVDSSPIAFYMVLVAGISQLCHRVVVCFDISTLMVATFLFPS